MKNTLKHMLIGLTAFVATSAIAVPSVVFTPTTVRIKDIPRGTSQTAILNITNPSLTQRTNTLSLVLDPIYDSVGGTNLVWLRSSVPSTLIVNSYTNTAGGWSSNLTLTAYTQNWTSSNQFAEATLTLIDQTGLTSAVPVRVSVSGIYAPSLTNRWLNIDGTTNVVVVIPQSVGAPIIYQWLQNSP